MEDIVECWREDVVVVFGTDVGDRRTISPTSEKAVAINLMSYCSVR